jgi:hypothetical protein
MLVVVPTAAPVGKKVGQPLDEGKRQSGAGSARLSVRRALESMIAKA